MAKKPQQPPQEEQPVIDMDQVLFQGPLFGREVDLKTNPRLVKAGLVPAKQIVSDALSRRAHTLLVEPKGEQILLRFVIDGIPYPAGMLPKQRGSAILQMLKMLAGLEVNVRDQPQDGGIRAEFREVPYELLIDVTPVGRGAERLRLRANNLKHQIQNPVDAHMPESVRVTIRELTGNNSGILLVCGPPQSGVTTNTLVTLHAVDRYLYQVYSLADIDPAKLNNVTPFKRNPDHDLPTTLDRLLRQEGDIVFMDPLTDPQIAQVMFDYSEKVTFICEMPARDSADAVNQLIQWVGLDAVLTGLIGIVTQKLIRTLCDDCKQAFRPSPQILQRLGLPPETTVLYREPAPPPPDDPTAPTIAQLCAPCGGTPYHGRLAAYEIFEMSDGMKEVVAEGADPAEIRRQMQEDGMLTSQKDALRLVLEGKTSLEEVQRTFRPPGAPKRRPGKRRPGQRPGGNRPPG